MPANVVCVEVVWDLGVSAWLPLLGVVLAVWVNVVLLLEACTLTCDVDVGRDVGGVRVAGVGASCVDSTSVGGVRGIGSVRGAATMRKTSPSFRVHDTSASALGESSACVWWADGERRAGDDCMLIVRFPHVRANVTHSNHATYALRAATSVLI
jgi:hypothetical protein